MVTRHLCPKCREMFSHPFPCNRPFVAFCPDCGQFLSAVLGENTIPFREREASEVHLTELIGVIESELPAFLEGSRDGGKIDRNGPLTHKPKHQRSNAGAGPNPAGGG